jgi:hypothetical protein
MREKKSGEILHELRIGECFEGFIIGIAPPVAKKIQTAISKFITKAISEEPNGSVEDSAVFGEIRYNQWLIKGVSAEIAIRTAHQLKYTNEVSGIKILPSDYKIYQDNRLPLFDQE